MVGRDCIPGNHCSTCSVLRAPAFPPPRRSLPSDCCHDLRQRMHYRRYLQTGPSFSVPRDLAGPVSGRAPAAGLLCAQTTRLWFVSHAPFTATGEVGMTVDTTNSLAVRRSGCQSEPHPVDWWNPRSQKRDLGHPPFNHRAASSRS
ncbi:hypothetical protein SBA5_990004 [Candidatus Sulfotelmatomonas gaucii]|uniref:Uncharacterized protein n=1 Tax=Candidatus Sulfuritelmatomonas gaucii TaxID=2043161 RepID=A0A2N9MAV2_9BACT|nr:hypothetical protein SBA5_990004 [Candidatus Sulfotelmatomonas gaucii]